MNNRYLIAKTNWLIFLALMLGSTSSPAQTKKLSDWVNVQVEKKGVKVRVEPGRPPVFRPAN